MDAILTEAEADDVLAYWTGGDIKVNYHKKWFPSAAKHRQAETDAYITSKYSHLLFRAIEKGLFSEASMKVSIALIIILDQFSRHIFRALEEPKDSQRRRDAIV